MKDLEEMDSPSACEAQFDALPQQVAEERQGMVQLHLFIIESQAKGQRAKHIPAKTKAQDPPQGKAQADAVVPGVVKVSNVLSSSHHHKQHHENSFKPRQKLFHCCVTGENYYVIISIMQIMNSIDWNYMTTEQLLYILWTVVASKVRKHGLNTGQEARKD